MEGTTMTLDGIQKFELLDLLVAAIDGIDGYETGDLRYWDKKRIERARQLIGQVLTNA
jgi:hypothetical protein